MSVQMRKLTAAASVPLGTAEPPAPWAQPSRNGPNQDIAASPRLRLGASQPSPASGPDEGHRRWPRQDNSCLAAAGPPAPPPVAGPRPAPPSPDGPGLVF